MRRWLLYHGLTILDVLRLWPTVQHHVIIVAGICLPILLLLGLKNGHVAELREDLLKSPTGRQIVFWSGQQGELMTVETIAGYEQEIAGVEIVIPEAQRLVTLSAGGGSEKVMENVTLYSTRPGDPILGQYGGDAITAGGDGIVLMKSVADALQVQTGDPVIVTLHRSRDGVTESASTALSVAAVVDQSGGENSAVGYIDVPILSAMEQYVMGFQVRKFGWPAFKAAAPDTYTSYLIFCEKSNPLSAEDVRTLEDRGYVVDAVKDEAIRTLLGLLKRESLSELLVYRLAAHAAEGWQQLNLAPGQLARLTAADDLVLAWNEPKLQTIGGRPTQLVGLSLPRRTWLRLYMCQRECGFDFDAETFCIQPLGVSPGGEALEILTGSGQVLSLAVHQLAALPEIDPAPAVEIDSGAPHSPAANNPDDAAAPLAFTDEQRAALSGLSSALSVGRETDPDEFAAVDDPRLAPVRPPAPPEDIAEDLAVTASDLVIDPSDGAPVAVGPPTNAVAVAIVPMDLLAHLYAEERGQVEYDAINQLFVAVPRAPLFDKARLYANSIDDVPSVGEELRERGFAIMSEVTRIREIHAQDHSLQLLVVIVGAGVFLFGIGTVVSVLLDSTERKRGTIGILRVMGVSRLGVFYMVFLRAAIIGVLAAGVTLIVGLAAAALLAWQPAAGTFWANYKPNIQVLIRPQDALVVVAGALVCCMFGSLIPARKASGMDPFDAIVEGRFR